jgi:O-antigen ligase
VNQQIITSKLTLASKVCGVMTAAALVLSTAATVTLAPLTTFLCLVAGNLREKCGLIIRNPVAQMYLLFYAMFLLGVIYSTAPTSDILLVLRKYSKFLFTLMLFPLFVEEKWRKYAINSFLAAILIMLFASYLRVFGWLHWWVANGVVEVFKDSIQFNFLMAFAAYLCLLKITTGRSYCFFWGIFLALIVYTVLFRSEGRSGYFVFSGLMVLFFVQRFRWRGFIIAATSMILLIGLALAFSPTFKGRIDNVFSDIKAYRNNNELTSVGLRLAFVKNSLGLIKKHPVLGTGTGSYAKEYSQIKPTPLDIRPNPHNEYIYITVQFGVIGLMVLLLFFAVPLWYSRFLPENEKYIARGIIVSIMLGSLANSWLLDVTQGYCYAYFIALAFAALPKKDNPGLLH